MEDKVFSAANANVDADADASVNYLNNKTVIYTGVGLGALNFLWPSKSVYFAIIYFFYFILFLFLLERAFFGFNFRRINMKCVFLCCSICVLSLTYFLERFMFKNLNFE